MNTFLASVRIVIFSLALELRLLLEVVGADARVASLNLRWGSRCDGGGSHLEYVNRTGLAHHQRLAVGADWWGRRARGPNHYRSCKKPFTDNSRSRGGCGARVRVARKQGANANRTELFARGFSVVSSVNFGSSCC